MNPESLSGTKIGQTIERFRHDVSLILTGVPYLGREGDTVTSLIPREHRRRVWWTLRRAGWKLPPLERPPLLQIPIGIAFLTSIVLALLAAWVLLAGAVAFLVLYWVATLPWAVHPHVNYESLELLALNTTEFRLDDYRRGLWPSELVAARVRLIISGSLNLPYQEVTPDQRIEDLW